MIVPQSSLYHSSKAYFKKVFMKYLEFALLWSKNTVISDALSVLI